MHEISRFVREGGQWYYPALAGAQPESHQPYTLAARLWISVSTACLSAATNCCSMPLAARELPTIASSVGGTAANPSCAPSSACVSSLAKAGSRLTPNPAATAA
ncbi:hypothetical protein G6F64_014922 [Rhizopus arrhizus]|uniref:Uncharacterized protein n=1 Tax=Rhizopus oryzae TaxID=64495 RepID=A0A9P6WSI6_RHIOR|nr:hypothetical protein G6F64_014922 [Rhizopus arrhizus]